MIAGSLLLLLRRDTTADKIADCTAAVAVNCNYNPTLLALVFLTFGNQLDHLHG